MKTGKERLTAEEKKDELLTGLRDVRCRILALVEDLPEQKQREVFLGKWSVMELLAHLAGWDETNLLAAQEVLSGQMPSFYSYHDKDWAAYNDRLVTEFARDDFGELLELVRETHNRLLTFIQALPGSELWRDRNIRFRGWKVMIGRLLESERKDEEVHFQQLKHFVDTGSPLALS